MAPTSSPTTTTSSSSTSTPSTLTTSIQTKTLVPSSQHTSYFTPAHTIPPGSVEKPTSTTPTLFTPLTVRSHTLKNRIVVSPMCQYSCSPSGPDIGTLTPYHLATLGHYALKGAGLVFTEALAVQPCGRISPNDAGLWSDHQIEGVRSVADFVHSQNGLLGVQLAHAGRKASQNPPWVTSIRRAGWDVGGWGPGGVVGPSGGEEQIWDGIGEDDKTGAFWQPKELSIQEIEEVIHDFKKAAIRAVKAGVDIIEIHGAHGYLIHEFLSPVTNRRRDTYGGSFEGRTRLIREVIGAVKSAIPQDMPLFLRLSATDWLEGSEIEKNAGGSWNVQETTQLAKLLPELGVDLLDVSSGGNHKDQDISLFRVQDYQTRNAALIRKEVKKEGKTLLIGAVGLITDAEQARDLIQGQQQQQQQQPAETTIEEEAHAAREVTQAGEDGKEPAADVVFVARQFMREPEWVLRVAAKLGVDVAWPTQFRRVRFPKM